MRQPWIGGAWFDGAFILGPALLVTGVVLAFQDVFATHPVPPLVWAVLVVGVDVGHVYSTLYRTYFDRAAFARHRTLYMVAPVLGWAGFACLYALGAGVFWRVLAYLAVFHFVRQQYGFMMLYGRRDEGRGWVEKAAIYAATLGPILWWHAHPRRFAWFVEGDFWTAERPWLGWATLAVYTAIMTAYAVKELGRPAFNWPRNLLLLGTAVSWGVGIVVLDSDLAFTALNVLAHGVPYVALVWLYGRTGARLTPGRVLGLPATRLFSVAFLPLFLLVPIAFAYLEEGVWDGMVWADHPRLFAGFANLGLVDSPDILALLVPLLALPQITHYVLDAFIWRARGKDGVLRAMLA